MLVQHPVEAGDFPVPDFRRRGGIGYSNESGTLTGGLIQHLCGRTFSRAIQATGTSGGAQVEPGRRLMEGNA